MQFIASCIDTEKKTFALSEGESHHIIRVLRRKPGEVIRVFDGKGKAFFGRITAFESDKVLGIIIQETGLPVVIRQRDYRISIYQSLPKGQKWEWVLEKGCEVGVDRFIPVISKHTIKKINKRSYADKLERWKKITEASAKQCERSDIPEVFEPVDFNEAVSSLDSRESTVLPLFLWEGEERETLSSYLKRLSTRPGHIVFFIGPEGGWSPEEVDIARNSNIPLLGLGTPLLRTETAPIVAASMALAVLEQDGI
ncbi:RsmE family RNA methyltransferase [Elusimicrobiota bacterium]